MKVTCYYCKRFQKARSDLRKLERISNTISLSKRYCVFANEYVFGGDPACEDIEKVDIFWCSYMGAWLFTSICIDRNRKRDKCVKECKDEEGDIILSLSRVGPVTNLRPINNGTTKLGTRGRRRL